MLLLNRRLCRLRLATAFHFYSAKSLSSRKVLQKFKLADIGEGITECEIIKWSVKPQTNVQIFDPLCEVQSDKASVEITSPYNGVVRELLVKEGEIAKVGAGLCMIEVEQEGAETSADPVDGLVENNASSSPSSTSSGTSLPDSPPPVRTEEPVQETVVARKPHPMDPNHACSPNSRTTSHVLAKPSVRHFARSKGVDLNLLAPGSGSGGKVEKSDVEAYLSRGSEIRAPSEGDVIVELGRTRHSMWKAMTKSLEIPHFGYSTTFDLTAIHHLLPILNAHIPSRFLPPGSSPHTPPAVSPSAVYPVPTPPPVSQSAHFTRLTFLPILIKTLSKAMLAWPLLRSSITIPLSNPPTPDPNPTLTVRPHADICIALSTPTGLYTPVVQQADTLSIYSLASRLKHLTHLGRQVPCKLRPEDMPRRGGTITVSNIGAIGAGDFAAPVLVPGGGVAIVAVGRAKWIWDVDRNDGRGERRLKVGLSWSADHRVVEGAELAAFVECWRGYVEVPERLIAEGV